MAGSKKSSIPAWQQRGPDAESVPEDKTLELARRFLDDENVKAASPDEKRAFLKSKGLEDSQITQLLDEFLEESQSSAERDDVAGSPETETEIETETKEASSTSIQSASPAVSSTTENIPVAASSTYDSPPPIVTYPEFLTTPQRPPPLITPSRVANILAASGGVWALVYGIAGLAVKPMVDNLNESRADYYGHVNNRLGRLVRKLEGAVSEIPYGNKKSLKLPQQDHFVDDNESVSSDPTELFHRDVGTQTSPPPSIIVSTPDDDDDIIDDPVERQSRRLSAIGAALREVSLMQTQRAESKADLKSSFGDIQDQLDRLSYPPVHDFSVYGGYGYGQSSEPDDQFKKTKDSIRSVKGLLLSARSFPVVATR
ncbi:peroxisomal membrane anchor protein conserved region-domain-containing protein [Xylaria nigripes]|nr:peroxisomal membrane anchor protein conserved region-domain-containing protein [Xylaria nigripes]